MDAFLATTAPKIPASTTGSALDTLSLQLGQVIELLSGRTGRVVAEMVGEGQSDPHILEEFRERFFTQLLAPARVVIDQGKLDGELNECIDTGLALDLMYGPIYYRLLVGHRPLDGALAKGLADTVLSALLKAAIS